MKRKTPQPSPFVLEQRFEYGAQSLGDHKDVGALFKAMFPDIDREVLVLATLDMKNCPLAVHVVHVGQLNQSFCDARTILRKALLDNAGSIILGHNHPSGDVTPSSEDIRATDRIAEAARIVGVDLLDHVIWASQHDQVHSMRKAGVIR